MYEFYVIRGHTIDELVNLSVTEKKLMHHAMEEHMKLIEVVVGGIMRGGECNR